MTKGFNFLSSAGGQHYDEPCLEIFHDEDFVAMLSQEKGVERSEIEIWGPKDGCWNFAYEDFEKALEKSYTLLVSLVQKEIHCGFDLAVKRDKAKQATEVNILFDGGLVATIFKQAGQVALKMQAPCIGGIWKFSFQTFLLYLKTAKKLLDQS